MQKFVLIESNTSGSGELCIEKARHRGFEVLFFTAQPNLYGFLSKKLISPIIVDTSDPGQIEQCLSKHSDIAGVWSTSEYYTEVTAVIAKKLSLPGADLESIRLCRDKSSLYSVLHGADIPCPHTTIVTSKKQLTKMAGSIDYPVVIKPAEGSGSVGVRLINVANELIEHGSNILSTKHSERGLKIKPKLLVQSFISGEEYSVEVVGLGDRTEVLGVTKKYLGDLPFFVERGHDFPAALESEQREAIVSAVLNALRIVGYRFGPAHVECRVQNGKTTIIEINPRLAGGMIPSLIERSTGIDVLEAMIDLYTGKKINLNPAFGRYSAIRFIIADRPGFLEKLDLYTLNEDDSTQVEFSPLKNIGDEIVQHGDFRDRLGYVIGHSDSHSALKHGLSAINNIDLVIASGMSSMSNTGRLKNILNPEALAIVRKPSSGKIRLNKLHKLASIDQAHLIMLVQAGIYSAENVTPILIEINRQKENGYNAIINRTATRGLYSLYEQLIVSQLGVKVAGIMHTARSRNDINACLSKLEMREHFEAVYRCLWQLRSALLDKANISQQLNLPVYSQYQAGQPGSLAYYLWSVEKALSRDQVAMCDLLTSLDSCPLGACAGAGSDFPIRPDITAKLLGFTQSFDSALDAVASRDLVLRLMSCLAIVSTTLSRLAQDFQLWTMAEIDFISLPDDLCGGSSIMPQKRNPYLLEIIKGKLVDVASSLNFAIFSFQRTPFSNSVEVGTEGISHCKSAVAFFIEACDLLRLIVDGAEGNNKTMSKAASKGLVMATQVANQLVREKGISFQEAHHQIGSLITEAVTNQETATESFACLTKNSFADIAKLKDDLQYGQGPGSVKDNLPHSFDILRRDSLVLPQLLRQWQSADQYLQQSITSLIEGET